MEHPENIIPFGAPTAEQAPVSEKILRQIEEVSRIPLLNGRDLPNIDLYMEQMLCFLEENFGSGIHESEKPVFTKPMVNNYTKAGLLPRPVRKKYSREHLITLIYITLLKQSLSFAQIERAFALSPESGSLPAVYEELTALVEDYRDTYRQAQEARLARIRKQLGDACDPRTEALLFLTLTSVESAVNQILCAHILDDLQPAETAQKKPQKAKKDTEKKPDKAE